MDNTIKSSQGQDASQVQDPTCKTLPTTLTNSLSHGLTEVLQESQEKWWKLYFYNGVYMGDVIMNDDGYYVFFPESKERHGYWTQGDFQSLYTYLYLKNKDWDESVNEFFR